MDISYQVDEVHFGENHVSFSVDFHLGGKAANVSVALKKLGIQSQLIADIGNDPFGQRITEELKTFGVISLLKVKPAMTGFTFIVVESDGTNTMFNYPGANLLLSSEDVSNFEKELLSSDIVFYQTGAGNHEEIIRYLKTLRKPIFLELSEVVEIDLLDEIDFASLNKQEALNLTKERDIDRALEKLLSYGIKNIFLKLGEKGSVHASRQGIISKGAFKIKPVDTTGAGYSFSAGCIYGILHDFSVEKILEFANKCAAITCTRLGTVSAFPSIDEVEKLS
ncbi:carbohydrate kinase family protein [Fervidobacterium islandicum]|uniref:carbohydrate kinase family protein n=1 Tax=Fervidobacterium islandicum TaxID=2423 RepID=UPI003A633A80